MAKKQSLTKQRGLLIIIVVFSMMSMIMASLLFFDIDARAITDTIVMDKVQYVNVTTVYVPENYIEIWNDRYESEDTEFIYCLYGASYEDDGYVVTEMTTTDVIKTDEESITYTKCDRNREYLGNIHSHPQPDERYLRATCDLSKQDIYTFGSEAQILTGVICGENKIALYGTDDFETSFQIKLLKGDETK